MWIGPLDVHDDELLRQFWLACKEGHEHERPYAAYWSYEAAVVAFRAVDNPMKQHPIVAIDDDGTVVGGSQVITPQRDNMHLAYGEPIVRPAYRRRGTGAALLEAALAYAAEQGRTTYLAETHLPIEGDRPGESAGSRLLSRYGFTTASLELHRVLDVPVARERLEQLAADTASRHEGYRLVPIGSAVPDDLVAGFCNLQEAFLAEVPLGDLDMEPEVWDVDRVRKNEDKFRRQGREQRRVAAIAFDGTMAALTELMTTKHQPEMGLQGGTLVLPAHRGHRLGLAIKLANLIAVQDEFPLLRRVHSWNAEENDAMVSINDQLGFRPVEYTAEMQRKA